MSDTEESGAIGVAITLYPEESSEKAIRQIGFGISPFIMLEVSESDEGQTVFEYTGSLVDDHAELADLLDAFASILRDGLPQIEAAAEEAENA